jgi:small nuclear ribonucleoprotein (snRNP)-like protein
MRMAMKAPLLSLCLLCALGVVLPGQATAAPKVVPVEGVSFNVAAAMGDNLQGLVGKRVSVTLDSGNVLTGIVGTVGDHMLHLEKLERKEYFDALVRIDAIRAIETRFREIKR